MRSEGWGLLPIAVSAGDALALMGTRGGTPLMGSASRRLQIAGFHTGLDGSKLLYEVTSFFGSAVEFSLASCVR